MEVSQVNTQIGTRGRHAVVVFDKDAAVNWWCYTQKEKYITCFIFYVEFEWLHITVRVCRSHFMWRASRVRSLNLSDLSFWVILFLKGERISLASSSNWLVSRISGSASICAFLVTCVSRQLSGDSIIKSTLFSLHYFISLSDSWPSAWLCYLAVCGWDCCTVTECVCWSYPSLIAAEQLFIKKWEYFCEGLSPYGYPNHLSHSFHKYRWAERSWVGRVHL